ncbi:2Fe-2S iron-sulfur cluster-binding protein [Gilliamella sp. WF3-4]|jgi:ferredoxin, 2Fe-2S|uniref:2Fe-2S iron-sulfur cluster-binding protein n=1 Tax=Gilliamella sp. WF3-4 TaxID=3120255 RepID=UPI00080E2A0F|nr:2Fe-2S iron-sulfur cluster-binding protein [Gilliamella apicola]OCG16953.1 hypothetical protein A9G47_09875 [Gilliamella apicola]
MIKVKFIDSMGKSSVVDVAIGENLMQAAVRENIPGIDAFCGGSCACATCVINIDSTFADKIPPALQDEKDVLEFTDNKTDYSRLSCQVIAIAELNGLVVHVPSNRS